MPRLIVKLVDVTDDASKREVGNTFVDVLHVTPRAVPVAAVSLSKTNISLLDVTRAVFTVQVPPLAFVAQEKCPAAAEPHEATDGFAAVPTAAQFVSVPYVVAEHELPVAQTVPPFVGRVSVPTFLMADMTGVAENV